MMITALLPQTALNWLEQTLKMDVCDMTLLQGGLGRRRFYRVGVPGHSYVIMYAEQERVSLDYYESYIPRLTAAGVRVPKWIAGNEALGLCVLEDLGEARLCDVINSSNATHFDLQVVHMWQALQNMEGVIPRMDKLRYRDKAMLIEPYVLGDWHRYQYRLEDLTEEVMAQPEVICHRDLHSLNIMVLADDDELAYIDFQGLSYGPLTYDWSSYLCDSYVDIDPARVNAGFDLFYEAYKNSVDEPVVKVQVRRYFDLTTLLRHVRCYALFKMQTSAQWDLSVPMQRLKQSIESLCSRYSEYAALSEIL